MAATMSWHSYLIFLGAYTVAAMAPGPVVMAISARALGRGFRAALPMVAGACVGDFLMLTLSVAGLAALAQAMGPLFLVVKLAGAAYLVWLGIKMWTAPVEDTMPDLPARGRGGFLAQMAMTAGNPKTIAFWVALVPTVIDSRGLGFTGYLQLAAACFTVTPAVLIGYAGLAARVRRFVSNAGTRRRINKGAGLAMAGAGATVALS
ncbi:LysE family translocator [Rhizomicrobium electricum]|jgi:threonine/homoserine/homoserine lactone efflux protein|uniref:LysE family translocator n=1 Tax=Rhizomicrobium electricum TaxID=480070 RepID=A0ABP3P6X4_9PROT|nr:LysE family translocator [Rhizomicrobium electricum]NIJ47583.1 threonine/homoserine/homoserine lactone efflux protein [Rhizomicrobium electricum]